MRAAILIAIAALTVASTASAQAYKNPYDRYADPYSKPGKNPYDRYADPYSAPGKNPYDRYKVPDTVETRRTPAPTVSPMDAYGRNAQSDVDRYYKPYQPPAYGSGASATDQLNSRRQPRSDGRCYLSTCR